MHFVLRLQMFWSKANLLHHFCVVVSRASWRQHMAERCFGRKGREESREKMGGGERERIQCPRSCHANSFQLYSMSYVPVTSQFHHILIYQINPLRAQSAQHHFPKPINLQPGVQYMAFWGRYSRCKSQQKLRNQSKVLGIRYLEDIAQIISEANSIYCGHPTVILFKRKQYKWILSKESIESATINFTGLLRTKVIMNSKYLAEPLLHQCLINCIYCCLCFLLLLLYIKLVLVQELMFQ